MAAFKWVCQHSRITVIGVQIIYTIRTKILFVMLLLGSGVQLLSRE